MPLARISHTFSSRSGGRVGLTRRATEAPANVGYGTPRRPKECNTVRTDHCADAVEGCEKCGLDASQVPSDHTVEGFDPFKGLRLGEIAGQDKQATIHAQGGRQSGEHGRGKGIGEKTQSNPAPSDDPFPPATEHTAWEFLIHQGVLPNAILHSNSRRQPVHRPGLGLPHHLLKCRSMMRSAARTETAAWGVPEGPELTRGITLPSQIRRLSISWDSK